MIDDNIIHPGAAPNYPRKNQKAIYLGYNNN
jgi:hypothetical protein